MVQPVNQVLREAGAAHLVLGRGDVVFDAEMLNRGAVTVEHSVTGTRVAVPGLPYAAGVDDATLAVQRNGLPIGESLEQRPAGVFPADERVVGMSYQTVGCC